MTTTDAKIETDRMPEEFDGSVHIAEPEGGEPGYVVYQDRSGTAWGFTAEQARDLGCELLEAAAIVDGLNRGVLRFVDAESQQYAASLTPEKMAAMQDFSPQPDAPGFEGLFDEEGDPLTPAAVVEE